MPLSVSFRCIISLLVEEKMNGKAIRPACDLSILTKTGIRLDIIKGLV